MAHCGWSSAEKKAPAPGDVDRRTMSSRASLFAIASPGRGAEKREVVVPTLAEMCLDCVGKHLDLVEDLGPLVSPEQFAEMLARGRRISPGAVARIEGLQPQLATAAADAGFWARTSECRAAAARGVGPLPWVVARVEAALAPLRRRSDDAARPEPRLGAALRELGGLAIGVDALAATRAGVALGRFLRLGDPPPHHRASGEALLATWKRRAAAARVPPGGRGRAAAPPEPPPPGPAEAGDAAYLVPRVGKCADWRSVHGLLAACDAHKRERFRATAKRLYTEAAASKKLTKVLEKDSLPAKRRRRAAVEAGPVFGNVTRAGTRPAAPAPAPRPAPPARLRAPPHAVSRIAQPPPPRHATSAFPSRNPPKRKPAR